MKHLAKNSSAPYVIYFPDIASNQKEIHGLCNRICNSHELKLARY